MHWRAWPRPPVVFPPNEKAGERFFGFFTGLPELERVKPPYVAAYGREGGKSGLPGRTSAGVIPDGSSSVARSFIIFSRQQRPEANRSKTGWRVLSFALCWNPDGLSDSLFVYLSSRLVRLDPNE